MDHTIKCRKPDCESSLDTAGSPQWCKSCRAKYQREYQALRKEMSEGRGFAAGVAAFRAHIVGKFLAIPSSSRIDSHAAAAWVKTEPFSVPQD